MYTYIQKLLYVVLLHWFLIIIITTIRRSVSLTTKCILNLWTDLSHSAWLIFFFFFYHHFIRKHLDSISKTYWIIDRTSGLIQFWKLLIFILIFKKLCQSLSYWLFFKYWNPSYITHYQRSNIFCYESVTRQDLAISKNMRLRNVKSLRLVDSSGRVSGRNSIPGRNGSG